MKTREEIAEFIEGQFWGSIPDPRSFSHAPWHYGKCNLRQLMDFIFDGPPMSKEEEVFEPKRLRNSKVGKWRDGHD